LLQFQLNLKHIPYKIDNIKVSPEMAPMFIVKVQKEDLEFAKSIVVNVKL
jgi:hypothetical protein